MAVLIILTCTQLKTLAHTAPYLQTFELPFAIILKSPLIICQFFVMTRSSGGKRRSTSQSTGNEATGSPPNKIVKSSSTNTTATPSPSITAPGKGLASSVMLGAPQVRHNSPATSTLPSTSTAPLPATTYAAMPEETQSTLSVSHMDGPEDRSIPRSVKLGSTGGVVVSVDKSVVTEVVTDHFFPEVKFVNRDIELAWDESQHSFCQFFIQHCNVPLAWNHKDWWNQAKKLVAFLVSQTRNDRNTAVKNAFVGKSIIVYVNPQESLWLSN